MMKTKTTQRRQQGRSGGRGDYWEMMTETERRRGVRICPAVFCQIWGGGGGGRRGGGDKEYAYNGDKFNRYNVNGDVLQCRVETRNGAALTLEGCNW